MISADALQDEVAAIGLLTGILTESGNDLTVNPDWFKDPLASTGPSLANVGERLQSLVTLIAAVLGPGIDNPPPVFSGAHWYAVPDPNTGGSTPFHVVAPAPTATGGEIGFGVLHAMQLDNFITEVYVYIPLFQYGSSGTE